VDAPAILSWLVTVSPGLLDSQRLTLSLLVFAALRVGRVSLAALGRLIPGQAKEKHKIKRAERFCANPRVHVADAMSGLIQQLGRNGGRLLVAVDWVEFRGIRTLVAACVFDRRSVPLLWASYREGTLRRSQNDVEEALLRLLASLLPEGVEVVLLADRGFGRAEMARLCGELDFRFVIRIKPDVYVSHPSYKGVLRDYKVKRGIRRVLKGCAYRQGDPVLASVVIRWKKGLPAARDEPWFLMTDLAKRDAIALTECYGRRMGIEETFRDCKNVRNGFGLRLSQVKKVAHFDRLLLVVVLAYWLLSGAGLIRRRREPVRPARRRRRPRCSAFTLGVSWTRRDSVSPAEAVAAVLASAFQQADDWG
jgi:Transposase DDE domain